MSEGLDLKSQSKDVNSLTVFFENSQNCFALGGRGSRQPAPETDAALQNANTQYFNSNRKQMKARPFKLVPGEGYQPASVEDCSHVKLNIPGITGVLYLPVLIKGTRHGTNCWTWNGDVDKPTLRPSVKTTFPANPDAGEDFKEWRTERICHSWINDGNVVFLDDCTHEYKGQTVPLIEIE